MKEREEMFMGVQGFCKVVLLLEKELDVCDALLRVTWRRWKNEDDTVGEKVAGHVQTYENRISIPAAETGFVGRKPMPRRKRKVGETEVREVHHLGSPQQGVFPGGRVDTSHRTVDSACCL